MRVAKGVLSVATVGLMYAIPLAGMTWLTNGGLVGYQLAHAQETRQVPLLQPGTIFKDPNTGQNYRVGSQPQQVVSAPPGYHICPGGHAVTANANEQDVQEATSRTTSGGTVVHLCDPATGLKVEQVTHTGAEVAAGSPWVTTTEPHR